MMFPNPSLNRSRLCGLALGVAAVSLASFVATAVPYATCVTNTGSAITFRLNEAADTVKIIYNNGATTNNLGVRPAGLNTVNLAVPGTFKIEVTKTSGAGYLQGVALQISADSNPLLAWEQPVGVAVNRNPASPYFGRIYVANSRSLATASGRPGQDGIYVINPDFTDALGQDTNALTGGIDFTDKSADNQNTTLPWRLEVGEDDNLYIADFTTNSGTIYVTDPNVSTGSGTNVLEGLGTPGSSPTAFYTHGQIASSVIAVGSLAKNNLTLYALDADTTPVNGLKRYDVGGGPLPSSIYPTDLTGYGSPLLQLSRVIVDLDRAPNGKFFLSQHRSVGNEPGISVIDNQDADQDGYLDLLYSSLGDWRNITGNFTTNDYMNNSYCIKVSPDGKYLAVGTYLGPTHLLPLDPTTGLPNLLGRITVNTASGGPTRDVCFDAAGNLYIVNNNIERLRVFSPGGKWVATTGSDGTFFVTNPPVTVPDLTLTATATNMYERVASHKVTLTATRIGDTASDLTVNLTLGGSAVNGVDYSSTATSLVIPAGATSASLTFAPIDNSVFTDSKTILVSITPSSTYNIVPTAASVALQIQDDEAVEGKVLFADDFEANTAANYATKFSAAGGGLDYQVDFAYDYSVEGIPPAPHSVAGTTKGLKVRVNKNFVSDGGNFAGGVNVYPIGKSFSGDFAFRADVLMSIGDGAGSTEHTLFGINHSGSYTNRHGVSGTDGLWFAVDTDGSNNRGFGFYGTANSSSTTLAKNNSDFNWAFPSPPYGFAGAPGIFTNVTAGTGTAKIWADLEVRQVGGVVTMKLDNTPIFQFTNTYAYNSGTIMIGHNDEFASLGSVYNYSLFDNVRVIDLSTKITNLQVSGGNALIDFATPSGGAFTNYSAATIAGPYTPDTATTYITNAPGVYRAIAPTTGATRFYQIRRAPLAP